MKDLYGRKTALYSVYDKRNTSIEVISKMIEMGAQELLSMINKPSFYTSLICYYCDDINDVSTFFVRECILATNICGKFGISGLFSDDSTTREKEREQNLGLGQRLELYNHSN